MDLSQIRMDFKSNPFNWIWIRYKIWYIFGLSKLHFGLDFALARSRLSQDNSGPRLSKVGSSPRPAESFGPKLNRVGMGQSRAKSFQAKVEPGQPWAKSSWGANIESTRVGWGRYRVELD